MPTTLKKQLKRKRVWQQFKLSKQKQLSKMRERNRAKAKHQKTSSTPLPVGALTGHSLSKGERNGNT